MQGIKTYKINGINYEVSEDREDQFLKDFPNAQVQEEKSINFLESLKLGFLRAEKDYNTFEEMLYAAGSSAARYLMGAKPLDKEEVKRKMLTRRAIKTAQGGGLFASPIVLDKYVEKLEQEQPVFEASIGEDFKEGRISQAAVRTVDGFLQSAPSFLAASLGPGGFLALGASVAGGKFEEELKNSPEKALGTIIINSIGSGAIEAGFELVTRGVLKKAGVLRNNNINQAKDFLDSASSHVVKKIGLGFTEESLSESATELSVALFDKLTLNRDLNFPELKYRLIDAGIIGGFSGGTITSVGSLATRGRSSAEEILMPEDIRNEINARAENINKLSEVLVEAEGEAKSLIEEKILKEKQQILRLKNKNSKTLQTLKGDDLKTYANNVEKISRIRRAYNKSTSQAEKNIFQDEFKDIANNNNEILKNSINKSSEKVISDIKEQAKEADIKVNFVSKTAKEISEMDLGKEDSTKASQSNGFIREFDDGSFQITLNKDKPAIGVEAHEFLHAVLNKTLKTNPDIQNKLADALKEYTNNLSGDQTKLKQRLSAYKGTNNIGEETITIMSESILNGDLKFNENLFTKIGDIIRQFLRQNGIGEYKFNTGKDVYNFIKDYNKSVSTGVINKSIIKVAKEGAQGELVDATTEQVETQPKTSFSLSAEERVQIENEVNDIGNTYRVENGKETWDQGGADITIQEIRDNKYFDNLIASKYKGDRVPVDFVDKVYAELTSHIKNFNPEVNDNLFGYINSQVANKAGNVYNREYKATVESRAVDIDAKTTEGAPVIQIEDDPDTEITRIEEEDLSLTKTPETSKLRKNLKLDKTIINKVKQAVVKTFGTKLPEVTTKKFKSELQKSFRTELKKPIQDIIGTREKYESFINDNAKFIFDALPAQTLVQFERNLPAEQRIFTTSRRITKPVEVDKLISEGKLPKNTNRLSGPQLHTKRAFPGAVSMQAFFRGINMQDQLGYEVGSSTLGTRKDKLAMELGVELAFDATSEVLQDPEVKNRRKDILELQGFEKLDNDLALVAKQIDRDPNVKFSKALIKDLDFKSEFDLETKIDKLLPSYDINKTYSLDNEENINEYIQDVIKYLFPLMPKEFWFGKPDSSGRFGTAFTPSSKVLKNKELYKNYYEPQIKKLIDLPDENFGSSISGVSDFSKTSYKTLFKDASTIKRNIGNGKIKEFNKKVSKIHETLWLRINDAIKNDANAATVIGNYLKITAADTKHWHKLGAQFVGYSSKPTLRYEYEHAMPATAAYLYLLDASLSKSNFKAAYKAVMDNYKLIALDKAMDKKLTKAKLQRNMPKGWSLLKNFWWQRYFNSQVELQGGIDAESITMLDGKTMGETFNIKSDGTNKQFNNTQQSVNLNVKYSKEKGMSTFDFDETLIIGGDNFIVAKKGDETIRITSSEWPVKGSELAADGYTFDFKDFVNVRGGSEGPLLQKMRNQIKKYGPDNVFVLTARMQEASVPIHEWLKTKNINIPLENITGLGNSTGEAKAEWMLSKFAEGYNDMYFVDDAMSNVKAVKQVLDNLDIKSKVVQAKIKFSKNANKEFNNIIQRKKGIAADKTISAADAIVQGKKSDKFRFFVPPSAEDFKGLIYGFLGKGKQGEKDLQFFKDNLFNPFAKATRELNSIKQKMSEEYSALKNKYPDVVKDLKEKVANTNFTLDNAIRVYLWNLNNIEIPGLSETEQNTLVDFVDNNEDIKTYAGALASIARHPNGYLKPSNYWVTQSIGSDLIEVSNKTHRQLFLNAWVENKNIIFSQDNLNKIEAAYGSSYREALENILYRMETGSNRPSGQDGVVNKFLNWINGSVGAIMFFNTRSAVLQTLSTVNFINFQDNNIFKAAARFADQEQFWKDFSFIYNSDMLKQRRAGLKIDVNAAELSNAYAQGGSKSEAVIKYLLEKGFLPTQIADSFAISAGGSTFYRNRINKYIKEGKSKAEAEQQAFLDFQEIAEETQQSSRPDLISMQQAGVLGRIILAFQNTPMQMTRLTKKAVLDLINNRGDFKANVSKILYYGAIQNIIFGSLQTALVFSMFGTDEKDEEKEARKARQEVRVLNGLLDTLLRGTGVYGAAAATLKNVIIKWNEETNKGFGKQDLSKVTQEIVNLSPPIGSKVRKIMSAIKSYEYNKNIIDKMDHGINNPKYNIFANVVEAITNLPLARVRNKLDNINEAVTGNHELWQRAALTLGWNKWDLGIKDADIEKAREEVKKEKKEERKQKTKASKPKKFRCRAVKSDGKRCKNMTTNKRKRCYAHI